MQFLPHSVTFGITVKTLTASCATLHLTVFAQIKIKPLIIVLYTAYTTKFYILRNSVTKDMVSQSVE